MTSLLGVCAILALCALSQANAQDKKADASGTWSWTMQRGGGGGGGEPRKTTLKLKVEGDKVTGTLSAPGRGGQATDTAIESGKVSGDEISFTVTREFNGNKFVTKYSGKVSGDSIKGKIETERDGNARSRDWEAKREGGK
jgi:hypothetical protein